MASALLKAASAALVVSQTGVYAAQAVTSGTLNVLSFNVAGLPSVLQSNGETGDKTVNTKQIGTYFSKYDFDVIHVQEDFNYHAALYSTDTHPYRTPTSGGALIGSGLNTLADYPWVDFARVKWATCSEFSSNDCLTPKGFTFMRMQVSGTSYNSSATFVDVYNVHTDAGITDADLKARQANINQVLAYTQTASAGNAVLIFGDTNSRYSRTGDTAIRGLLDAGFTDAWVQRSRGKLVPTTEVMCGNPQALGNSTCETVDKVFYRSSPLVTLDATAFEYVGTLFSDPKTGAALSDHNPVNVNLTWTAGTQLQQSAYWGGPHGTWFNDADTLDGLVIDSRMVTELNFAGNERLDSVGVTLADGTKLKHGGTGGEAATLKLASGEYWSSAQLCQGQKNGQTRIFYIMATTSQGKTLTAGTKTEDCTSFFAPSGWAIVGFLGQGGDEVDQLGFVYGPAPI